MGFLGGLWRLANGDSVGSAFSTTMGFTPAISVEGSPSYDLVGSVVDSSAVGQSVNGLLGNSASTSAKELSARNDEMNYNHNEAQLTRDWLERMSNTAYQRAAADMKAAGLNPALLYGSSGASTPGASSASYSGYASAYANANASYRNSRLSSSSGIANSAISALARLGYAAIVTR